VGEIKKQGIQNTIITYLGIIIGFVSLILVQPFLLSKEEVGLVRVMFAFSSLIASIIPLGITSITIKYFPVFRNDQKGHHGFLGFIVLFPIAGGLIIYFLLSIFKDAIISHYVVNSKLFADYFSYVLPFSIVLGFITVLNTYCFSLFKTTIPSLLNDVLNRVMTIGIIVLYFFKFISLKVLIISYVEIYGIQLFLLILYMYTIDTPSLRVNREFFRGQNVPKMIGFGFLLSFASVASLGVKYLDSIMIAKYMPIEFVGIYSIVAFIPSVIEAPLNSLDRIAYVKMSSSLAANNRKEVEDIYYKSARYLFMVGGLLYLGVNINIADLLSFLPAGYSQGAGVVLIISTGTLLNMSTGTNMSIIFNSRFYGIGGFVLVAVAFLAFGLNVLLIPKYGLNGSAAATAITVTTFALIRFLIIYRGFKLQPYDSTMFKILLLIAGGMILHFLLPELNSPFLSIAYRSAIIISFYLAGLYFWNIAPEFHGQVDKIRKRIFK
jgi:O-antigen/teichoic acid export membrane protein